MGKQNSYRWNRDPSRGSVVKILTEKDIVYPRHKPGSHKGQNGKVLLIGGSERYVGAIALAGIAALRAGADLVTIAAPEKVAWAVNCLSADLITVKLPGKHLSDRHYEDILQMAKQSDVILLGNGAGEKPRTQRLIRRLASLEGKKIIDADGIKAVQIKALKNAIITPHPHELDIFLENSNEPVPKDMGDLQGQIPDFFAQGNVLLIKGTADTIISHDRIRQNRTGNPGMTRGGTGDVLAGLAAGLYAQIADPFDAACSAAFINGRIGDILEARHKGHSFIASDMIAEIKRLLEQG